MGNQRVIPGVNLGALGAVIPISGTRHVHIDSPIYVSSLRYASHQGPATVDEAEVIDQWLKGILADWDFADSHWCDDLLTAVSELTVNIAQCAEKTSKSKRKELHVLVHTYAGEMYRYLWVWVDGKGLPPCDPTKLNPELPDDLNAEHGRGTHMITEFTDAFLLIKQANSFIIMKRAPIISINPVA